MKRAGFLAGIAQTAMTVALAGAAMAQNELPGVRDESIARAMTQPDPFGARRALAERGITYELNYVFDLIGNASGGVRRGAVASGRTEAVVDVDIRKLIGLPEDKDRATILHVNAFHIHGAALSRSYIGNIAPVSNIEAFPAVRLFEAWVQQTMGPVSLRIGQLGSDSETAASSTAGQFNNGTFGWPAFAAGALPSGGPAYPLATPGATLKFDFASTPLKAPFSLLIGAYNGDPARPGPGDPQRRNRHGLDFSLRNGGFYVAEAKYDHAKDKPYAGSYKFGVWSHTGRFDSRRRDDGGLSLADPAGSGTPMRRRGNHGFYVIADQVIAPADADGLGQISLFARGFHSPMQDRNLLAWQIDAGLAAKGVFGRKSDSAGVALSYMKIAKGPRGLDRDLAALTPGLPVRSHEIAIEANYLYQATPGFTLQPSVQYIVRPGGGGADPLSANPAKRIANAAVLGLRGVVKY